MAKHVGRPRKRGPRPSKPKMGKPGRPRKPGPKKGSMGAKRGAAKRKIKRIVYKGIGQYGLKTPEYKAQKAAEEIVGKLEIKKKWYQRKKKRVRKAISRVKLELLEARKKATIKEAAKIERVATRFTELVGRRWHYAGKPGIGARIAPIKEYIHVAVTPKMDETVQQGGKVASSWISFLMWMPEEKAAVMGTLDGHIYMYRMEFNTFRQWYYAPSKGTFFWVRDIRNKVKFPYTKLA